MLIAPRPIMMEYMPQLKVWPTNRTNCESMRDPTNPRPPREKMSSNVAVGSAMVVPNARRKKNSPVAATIAAIAPMMSAAPKNSPGDLRIAANMPEK